MAAHSTTRLGILRHMWIGSLLAVALVSSYATVDVQQNSAKKGFLKMGPSGLNRLGDGQLYVDSKVKVHLSSVGNHYRMAIDSSSGSSYDVQLLFKIPYGELTKLTKVVQIDLEARADKEITGIVKADIAKPPYSNLGLNTTFAVGTEWKPFRFQFSLDPEGQLVYLEEGDPGIYCPALLFPSFRGNIEVRGVSLRNVVPSLGEIPVSPAPRTVGEAFRWLEALPKTFSDRDLGKIVGAWASSYKETFDTEEVKDRGEALKMWAAQISFDGEHASSNGPGVVWIESVANKGETLVMKGYWEGSWRSGDWTELSAGGVSFFNRFTTTWKKGKEGWQMISWNDKPTELSESETKKIEDAHKKLAKTYARG